MIKQKKIILFLRCFVFFTAVVFLAGFNFAVFAADVSVTACVPGQSVCGEWSDCVDGQRTRICTDGCTATTETDTCVGGGIPIGPIEPPPCDPGETICTSSECVNGKRYITCVNNCETTVTIVSCEPDIPIEPPPCVPGETICTSSECVNGVRHITCVNNCETTVTIVTCEPDIPIKPPPCVPGETICASSECVNGIGYITCVNNCETTTSIFSCEPDVPIEPPPCVPGETICAPSACVNGVRYITCVNNCEITSTIDFCPDDSEISIKEKIYQADIIGAVQETFKRVNKFIDKSETVKVIKEVIENPQVEQVTESVAVPVVTAVSAASTLTSISLLNLVSYIRFIFTQPLIFLFAKKRRRWGTVYDSLTKKPIDLAIIRLYRQSDKRLIRSRVTDREGRYQFLIDNPEKYYIEVVKPKYKFPTEFLKNKKSDVSYLDLYHGQTIQVDTKEGIINFNIPLDPMGEKEKPAKTVIFKHFFRKTQVVLSFASIPLSVLAVIIAPTAFTLSMLIINVSLWFIFLRLVYSKRPKSWGMVYEKTNKKPISRAIARIYDYQYNKLLETQVTNAKGRYSFLVNDNRYFITVEKPGYETYKSDVIDLISRPKDLVVDIDIGLNKSSSDDFGGKKSVKEDIKPTVEKTDRSQPAAPSPGVGRDVLEKYLKEKTQPDLSANKNDKFSSEEKTPENFAADKSAAGLPPETEKENLANKPPTEKDFSQPKTEKNHTDLPPEDKSIFG